MQNQRVTTDNAHHGAADGPSKDRGGNLRPRFSKSALRDWIDAECARLEREHQLDPRVGTAQLEGRNRAAILAYGRYDALQAVAAEFGLRGNR